MPNVYKTFTLEDIDNKQVQPVSVSDRQSTDTIVSNFITYFKNKHLS